MTDSRAETESPDSRRTGVSSPPPFVCLMCGECCRGRGGVYLDRTGAEAAAACLGLDFPRFGELFLDLEPSGLYSVASDPSPGGHCLLFRDGMCLIHPAKPPICRAWPRLRALVTDPEAFREAAEACPGLSRLGFQALASDYAEGRRALPPQSFRAVLLARVRTAAQGGPGRQESRGRG
ncbi:MAG: YkgJ family cysteine cluster protein [Deltaproteobacteria bacterium]|nr:YkgJ family cysteine cluster protein [Deltaproteobacteria bacterium]